VVQFERELLDVDRIQILEMNAVVVALAVSQIILGDADDLSMLEDHLEVSIPVLWGYVVQVDLFSDFFVGVVGPWSGP
jgi:hypothetical protein